MTTLPMPGPMPHESGEEFWLTYDEFLAAKPGMRRTVQHPFLLFGHSVIELEDDIPGRRKKFRVLE